MNYNKVLGQHDNKEEAFSNFRKPVAGTKYDIGMFSGSIFIPLLHVNNLGELPICIQRYSEDVLQQLKENIPGRIEFHFDCYARFFQFDGTHTKVRRDMPAFMKGKQIIDSPNQIHDLCDKASNDIMNFYDNIVVQKSGLTFSNGLALRIWYRKDESRDFKAKGKKGKKEGRSWIDHMIVKPFTKAVRGANMSKHIVNIKNDDDLCFLYNIILVKFFSDVKKHDKYFRYEREYTSLISRNYKRNLDIIPLCFL